MKTIVALTFLGIAAPVAAQRETQDLASYLPPAGWKKEQKATVTSYSTLASRSGSWCQVGIYTSTASRGTAEADFDAEWQSLAAAPFQIAMKPGSTGIQDAGGWKRRISAASFQFKDRPAALMLATFSGFGRSLSVLAMQSGRDCATQFESFIGSIELRKPASTGDGATPPAPPPPAPAPSPTGSGRFAFTSTNFDDGWVGTATDGWTEVRKGTVKVLVHYPHPQADAYHSVLRDGDTNAWNLLVAPRYTGVRNFEWMTIQSFESITFVRADAVERASGRSVHVVLFKKHYSKGHGRYLEFVADSRAAYEAEFGPYHNDEFGWDKNANMQFRNKFAVAAADLNGTWSANDYASLSYYYVSTGGFAGATATSTADQFTFLPGNTYQSEHTGASGVVGNQKWGRQVYKGTSTVANWSITLTNRFQGASESFNCYFEAIRGGRILVLTDRLGTTLSLVRQR